MDRRTERYLKETRERELDKFVLDTKRRSSHIVDLGRLGKVPITTGWSYSGYTLKFSDISYYSDPLALSNHWERWRRQVLVAFNLVDYRLPAPDFHFVATAQHGISYTFHIPVECVQDPIVWREDCPTRRNVERWLLRVQQEKELDTPPELEWE